MAAVPSLADALVVVILLVPGFVAVRLFARIAAFERKLSDFEITVYSLMVSLIIYVPFALITQLDTLDKIRDAILLPSTLLLLLGLSAAMGITSGGLVKFGFRKPYSVGSPWVRFVCEAEKRRDSPVFVLVRTVQGQEIVGQLRLVGTVESPRDIVVYEPRLITRDQDLRVKEQINFGREMFIPERSIEDIVIL